MKRVGQHDRLSTGRSQRCDASVDARRFVGALAGLLMSFALMSNAFGQERRHTEREQRPGSIFKKVEVLQQSVKTKLKSALGVKDANQQGDPSQAGVPDANWKQVDPATAQREGGPYRHFGQPHTDLPVDAVSHRRGYYDAQLGSQNQIAGRQAGTVDTADLHVEQLPMQSSAMMDERSTRRVEYRESGYGQADYGQQGYSQQEYSRQSDRLPVPPSQAMPESSRADASQWSGNSPSPTQSLPTPPPPRGYQDSGNRGQNLYGNGYPGSDATGSYRADSYRTGQSYQGQPHQGAPGSMGMQTSSPVGRTPSPRGPLPRGSVLGDSQVTATQHALRLIEENGDLKAKLAMLESENRRLKEKYSESENTLARSTNAVKEAQKEIEALVNSNADLQKRLDESEKRYNRHLLETDRMLQSIREELDDVLVREISSKGS